MEGGAFESLASSKRGFKPRERIAFTIHSALRRMFVRSDASFGINSRLTKFVRICFSFFLQYSCTADCAKQKVERLKNKIAREDFIGGYFIKNHIQRIGSILCSLGYLL